MRKTTAPGPRVTLCVALASAAAFGWSLSAPLSLPYLAYSFGLGLLLSFVLIGTKPRSSEDETVNPRRIGLGVVVMTLAFHTMFRDISTLMPSEFLWQYRVQTLSAILLSGIAWEWMLLNLYRRRTKVKRPSGTP